MPGMLGVNNTDASETQTLLPLREHEKPILYPFNTLNDIRFTLQSSHDYTIDKATASQKPVLSAQHCEERN